MDVVVAELDCAMVEVCVTEFDCVIMEIGVTELDCATVEHYVTAFGCFIVESGFLDEFDALGESHERDISPMRASRRDVQALNPRQAF